MFVWLTHAVWCEQCVNESHVNKLNESNPEEGPEIEDSKIEDLSKKLHTIQQRNEQKLRTVAQRRWYDMTCWDEIHHL